MIEIHIEPFVIEEDCEKQALKVLEEAAELLEAQKKGDSLDALEEACDVITATVNWCVAKGFGEDSIRYMLWRVAVKNAARGRY